MILTLHTRKAKQASCRVLLTACSAPALFVPHPPPAAAKQRTSYAMPGGIATIVDVIAQGIVGEGDSGRRTFHTLLGHQDNGMAAAGKATPTILHGWTVWALSEDHHGTHLHHSGGQASQLQSTANFLQRSCFIGASNTICSDKLEKLA